MNDIEVYDINCKITGDVDTFSKGLADYLEYLELPPAKDVLVTVSERAVVINNMPTIVQKLPENNKESADYLSKFIASCGVGLFDAALNYLWNETIVNLRSKISRFDIDYFYDSVIQDSSKRDQFKDESDLSKIDDWQLIKGCLDTGIITDIGYKHLCHIKDMRNYASAAHPNNNHITGLQIMGWLDSCIQHVLAKDPTGPVLVVKKLLINIRTKEIGENDVGSIIENIKGLPKDLNYSLLRAVFGMYTDEKIDIQVRTNIEQLIKTIWDNSERSNKYEIGLKYAILSANAEIERKKYAHQFLSIVDGLSYIPEDQLAIEMKGALERLYSAHNGFNNFYTEIPHAINLNNYVPRTGKIPKEIRAQYVRVLVICRMGNQWGLSFGAKPYYDNMISNFNDEEIYEFLMLTNDSEILAILEHPQKTEIITDIAWDFENKTVNEVLKKALHVVSESSSNDLTSKNTAKKVNSILKK